MNANTEVDPSLPRKRHLGEQVVAGLPLVLIGIGGFIGGVVGAGAYVVNLSIFRKDMPERRKLVYACLITLGAVVTYFVAAIALALVWPLLFGIRR